MNKDNVTNQVKVEKREEKKEGEHKESPERLITANQSPECLFSLIMYMRCNNIGSAVGMPQNQLQCDSDPN